MAYYVHREHPDATTVNFLLSLGAVKVSDCSDKHSTWSLKYKKLYIPIGSIVHDLGHLIDEIYKQAYNEGVGNGKQSAITTINQHILDLVFKRK